MARFRRAAALCAGLAAICLQGAAWAGPIEGNCSVRFKGSSSLHDFEGRVPCALFSIEGQAGGPLSARAEVETARMTTGLAARDARMREMFDAERNPRISASFSGLDPEAVRRAVRQGGPAPALAFELRIRGEQRRVVPSLSRWRDESGGGTRFTASFALSLRDFGLEAPAVMGLIRVDDRVEVEADVELRGLPAAATLPADAPRDGAR